MKSVPTVQSVRFATVDQNDIETVKCYLQAIANDDATVQPVRHTTVDQDDMEVCEVLSPSYRQ